VGAWLVLDGLHPYEYGTPLLGTVLVSAVHHDILIMGAMESSIEWSPPCSSILVCSAHANSLLRSWPAIGMSVTGSTFCHLKRMCM